MTKVRTSVHESLDDFASPVRRVEKPWGYELIYAVSEEYCGKVLFVRAGEALSLQLHARKDETIYVQSGRAQMEIGFVDGGLRYEVVEPGRSFRIRPGVVHRMRALDDTTFLEVSTPELEDVIRLDDRYGRVDGAEPDVSGAA